MNAGKGVRIEKALRDNYMADMQATVAPGTIHANHAASCKPGDNLSIVHTCVAPVIGRLLR